MLHGDYEKLFRRILDLGVKKSKHEPQHPIISVEVPKPPKRRLKPTRHVRGRRRQEPSLVHQIQDIKWLEAQFREFVETRQREENEPRNSNSMSDTSSDKGDSIELSPIHAPENRRSEDLSFGALWPDDIVSPKEKERMLEVNLNTRQHEPVEEEEEEQTQDEVDEDRMLRKFVAMFVTNSVFENVKMKRAGMKLQFPADKERPWNYNNENGDLIIDSVSEIMATADLSDFGYQEFLDFLAQQLKQRVTSAGPILERLVVQFQEAFERQELEIANGMADRLLQIELNRALNAQ